MWAGGKVDPSFPSGGRGGPPQPIVQRRTFDLNSPTSLGGHHQNIASSQSGNAGHLSSTVPQLSDSWSFYNLGSSRNKRKLPSGKETFSEFSCRDRPPGYYADINLGCEVSHIIIQNMHERGIFFLIFSP